MIAHLSLVGFRAPMCNPQVVCSIRNLAVACSARGTTCPIASPPRDPNQSLSQCQSRARVSTTSCSLSSWWRSTHRLARTLCWACCWATWIGGRSTDRWWRCSRAFVWESTLSLRGDGWTQSNVSERKDARHDRMHSRLRLDRAARPHAARHWARLLSQRDMPPAGCISTMQPMGCASRANAACRRVAGIAAA